MNNRPSKVLKQRREVHGDPRLGFRCLSATWHALLEEHWQMELPVLPPHVVSIMCSAFKLHRAVRPLRFIEDDYIDAQNYLTLAYGLDPQRPRRKK